MSFIFANLIHDFIVTLVQIPTSDLFLGQKITRIILIFAPRQFRPRSKRYARIWTKLTTGLNFTDEIGQNKTSWMKLKI